MRFTGLLISFLALSLLLLPALTAQEKKGDKKDPDKADKVDKKDPDKTDPEKPEKPVKKKPEEKPEHGPVLRSKIVSMKADSAHDFTIEVPMPDPQQMYNIQVWQAQQMQQIAQSPNPATYAQRMAQFQQQMAMKMARGEGYALKPIDVRASDACKVRMVFPPVQYDDAGNLKKWTRKELEKLKDGSKLPGYPADFDLLKTGQFVEIYLAKQHGSSKDNKWRPAQRNTKKKADEDPPEPMAEMRPEVVMIVILAEPMR